MGRRARRRVRGWLGGGPSEREGPSPTQPIAITALKVFVTQSIILSRRYPSSPAPLLSKLDLFTRYRIHP